MSDERNFKILMNRVLAGDRNSAYPPIQEWEKSAISWAMTQLDELAELRAKAEAQAASVPEGWKLVPIELTNEMQNAFWAKRTERRPSDLSKCYDAMLAAAPQPEQKT